MDRRSKFYFHCGPSEFTGIYLSPFIQKNVLEDILRLRRYRRRGLHLMPTAAAALTQWRKYNGNKTSSRKDSSSAVRAVYGGRWSQKAEGCQVVFFV